jgi:hypothetical protein
MSRFTRARLEWLTNTRRRLSDARQSGNPGPQPSCVEEGTDGDLQALHKTFVGGVQNQASVTSRQQGASCVLRGRRRSGHQEDV